MPIPEFSPPPLRPLPVILLLDVSKSMSADGKLQVMNQSVREMIDDLKQDTGIAEIQIAIVAFGGTAAELYLPLQPIHLVKWKDMEAKGKTPMGSAFRLIKSMLEDNEQIPSRAYAPTLVLVSDGIPTDDWKGPLEQLTVSARASKAARFAMAVGDDANLEMLADFINESRIPVFKASQGKEIKRFFRQVTLSVGSRSRSENPDFVQLPETIDIDLF